MYTDQDAFQKAFRSGLYNVVMILDQDIPFGAGFLQELREAVALGRIGLFVSGWGNHFHPILQSFFGVDFAGSLPMSETPHPLVIFDSPVLAQQNMNASGRILKTRLTSGTLAGIVPGESRCAGVHSVSFHYPTPVEPGARVIVSLASQQGKKLTLIDEEQGSVTALPMGGMNNSITGNPDGDLVVDAITAVGVNFTLSAPYGVLGSDYWLTVKVEHADGSVTRANNVVVTPTCDTNLVAGINVGPYQVLAVSDDRVKVDEDLPAVVLNQYGAGRTVFLAYNLIESALDNNNSAHTDLLRNAANYLLPNAGEIEPAGIALLETTVTLTGAVLDLTASDTLGEGLLRLPLFNLTQTPLEFRFHLVDGDSASYRYFVRFPDQAGQYRKETELFMSLEGTSLPYDRFAHIFTLITDSADLLQQATFLVEEMGQQHPDSVIALTSIDTALSSTALLPKTTAADFDVVINAILQILRDVEQLPFATDELQLILDRSLRVMEARQARE